jgi:hypothetical protein
MGKTRKNLYADIEKSKLDKDNHDLDEDTKPAEGKKANKLRQEADLHYKVNGMSRYETSNAYAKLAEMHKNKQSAG